MVYERTKILTLFAVFGFGIGTGFYFIFSWLMTNYSISTTMNLFLHPWFMSGIAGALLSNLIIVVFAHVSRNK